MSDKLPTTVIWIFFFKPIPFWNLDPNIHHHPRQGTLGHIIQCSRRNIETCVAGAHGSMATSPTISFCVCNSISQIYVQSMILLACPMDIHARKNLKVVICKHVHWLHMWNHALWRCLWQGVACVKWGEGADHTSVPSMCILCSFAVWITSPYIYGDVHSKETETVILATFARFLAYGVLGLQHFWSEREGGKHNLF